MKNALLEAAMFCSKNGDQKILFDGETVYLLLTEQRRTSDEEVVAAYLQHAIARLIDTAFRHQHAVHEILRKEPL